ncbi:hypothetical protein Tco_0144715 [Tanacetum coccineum]
MVWTFPIFHVEPLADKSSGFCNFSRSIEAAEEEVAGCEFFLVTGFKFGMVSFCEYRNGDIPFRYYMGRELVSVVDDVLLRMVDNLDAWNTFPWGEHIWRQLYDSIRNVSSKHKLEYLDGLRKNPNHVPSYSLSGFLFAFKIWIIESSCESDRWWTKVPELIPRAVAWTRKAEFFKLEYLAIFFHRSPPVSIEGLHGEYLNKRSAARAAKQKDRGEFQPGLRSRQEGREAALIDRVITLKTNHVEKEESDVNGHVPSVLMPANPISQQIYEDFSSDLAVLNGFCNLSQNEDEKGDCEIIRLADQRQQDDISKMAEEAEQKIESEIQRLYDHREARLNKIAKEEKQRKFIGHMNSSTHMKLAIERCVPKKRSIVVS